MGYYVINRMPYADFIKNEDGIPKEFDNVSVAIDEANKLEDAIVIDSYIDVRDLINTFNSCFAIIKVAKEKGIPDRNNVEVTLEQFINRYESGS